MKKLSILLAAILVIIFFLLKQTPGNNKPIVGKYPWQIDIISNGYTRVFGVILNETTLKNVDEKLNMAPVVALYESKEKLSLEAYYKNVSLGGMIGSFIFTLDATAEQLNKFKKESQKQDRTKDNEVKYSLDKTASTNAKALVVKNLIYIPTVQLDEETIIKRFGVPSQKIKLKNKELGWHYLYPEKGLDLIYKENGKEVLQYVSPKYFKALLAPL